MPIENFEGNTFVAFLDISGFKVLMGKKDRAQSALSDFYQIGFNVLREQIQKPMRVEGFFVSDCGILFVRNQDDDIIGTKNALANILNVIEQISKRMLVKDLMLTTSIAYGRFSYHQRIEFEGINKDPIYGSAYIEAFLDNERGKPKLAPGECRLLSKNLNEELWDEVIAETTPPFDRIQGIPNNSAYAYFYWMVQHQDQIRDFKKEYKDAYNLKFKGMLDALKLFPD